MEILYLLIPLSMVLVGVIVWALFFAIKSGQFDDMEGAAQRILMDDDKPQTSEEKSAESATPQKDDSKAKS